jgi:hypothetical protein
VVRHTNISADPTAPIEILYEKDSSREEIIAVCKQRFGLADQKTDDMIAKEKDFLTEEQVGHKKVFSINLETAERQADWFKFLVA